MGAKVMNSEERLLLLGNYHLFPGIREKVLIGKAG